MIPIKNTPKDDFSTVARNNFRKEVVDWFYGIQLGHLGKWRYDYLPEGGPASGGHLWEQLATQGKDYYVSRDGDSGLTQSIGFMLATIDKKPDWIIDLGPGMLRKAKRDFISAIAHKDTGYVPVDISDHFLENAGQLEREGIVRVVKPSLTDFTEENPADGLIGNKLFLFLGSTLGNLPGAQGTDGNAEATKLLYKIYNNMRPGDALLLGVDGNLDCETVLRCYNDPLSHAFLMALIYKIQRDLKPKGDFSVGSWYPKLAWDKKTKQCSHLLVASDDQTFSIDSHSFKIPKGAILTSSNSYKFSANQLRQILSEFDLNTFIYNPPIGKAVLAFSKK